MPETPYKPGNLDYNLRFLSRNYSEGVPSKTSLEILNQIRVFLSFSKQKRQNKVLLSLRKQAHLQGMTKESTLRMLIDSVGSNYNLDWLFLSLILK
jgi:hypothetical protein